jgi:hypothetical protein
VTKAGYAHEFEIKITRADFKADFKKPKHELYATGALFMPHPWRKGQSLEIPCRFWFVTAKGIVTLEDIPAYAGWMEQTGSHLKIMRPAPQLHKNKISDAYRIQLLESMMHRYWQARAKLKRRGDWQP